MRAGRDGAHQFSLVVLASLELFPD